MILQYTVCCGMFLVCSRFLTKLLYCEKCTQRIPCWDRKRTPKLMLHKILYVDSDINFRNKGLSVVQKLHVQCDS